jgi:DNA-binding CsgD family transcriptional regulator
VLLARGRLRIAQGEFESALADLRRAGELLIEIDMDNPSLFPWRAEASHAAMMAGDRDSAWALARAAMEATARVGVPVPMARAHRAMAAVSPGEDAIMLLRKGLELVPPAPEGPPRLERAHLLLALGSALRRSHRRAEAAEALQEALNLAGPGGAEAIAESARNELRLVGVRVPREPTGAGVDSLTPGERRVAELAAAGHTNCEIARLLFVTVKAVEYHLGNAYRKLGINRRTQLAPLFADEPPESAGVADP